MRLLIEQITVAILYSKLFIYENSSKGHFSLYSVALSVKSELSLQQTSCYSHSKRQRNLLDADPKIPRFLNEIRYVLCIENSYEF